MRWALFGVALALACVLAARARQVGDGWEYQCMLEGWFRHLSPEQRLVDAERVRAIVAYPGDLRDGFFPTASGRWFSYHFWFYPLLALPAKAVLHVLRADELRALAITNGVLFAGTIGLALRRASFERVAFVVLAATGSVIWYVSWPHAETFEWAFVVASLCAYERRRYALASLCAAVASLQAPPIALLTLPAIGAAAVWRRGFVAAVAGASVALVPAAFYWWMYGRPNLIVATGMASSHLMSVHRVLSLLFDLDAGMLPYFPAAVLLGFAAIFGRRRAEAMVFLCVALAMTSLATQTANFNAGCAGMNRYGSWVVPIFAFVGARALRPGARASALLAVGAALQAGMALALTGDDDANVHHSLAKFVLRHAPALCPQDIENFAERTTGQAVDWPFRPLVLPIAFYDAQGPTKLLVDPVAPHYVHPSGALPAHAEPDAGGLQVTFGDGWSYSEGRPPHAFRWMGERGELVVRRSTGAASTLRLVGMTHQELGSPPTLRITLGGAEVDRFVAPAGVFTRDIALPASDTPQTVTIVSSSTFTASDGRRLSYALTDSGPALTPRSVGGPDMAFSGDWLEPTGVPPNDERCMRGDASVSVTSAGTEPSVLVAFAVAPVRWPSSPSTWHVFVDGHELESGPLFRLARRIWPLDPGAHVVRFIASPSYEAQRRAALCFFGLRLVSRGALD